MKKIGGIVWVTSSEMREVDRLTVEEFGIPISFLMENAGRALAATARRMLHGKVTDKRILVLVGGGNNGGGGLVAARHLHNWGARISVVLGVNEAQMKELPREQLGIIRRIGIDVSPPANYFKSNSLIVDALLGYGQSGSPREPIASLISHANDGNAPILALDIPSGLNPDSGVPYAPCIRAAATLTLALPKIGLFGRKAMKYVGRLFLADISIPRVVYYRLGQRKNLFQNETVVRVMNH